jgi:hypothetical protein
MEDIIVNTVSSDCVSEIFEMFQTDIACRRASWEGNLRARVRRFRRERPDRSPNTQASSIVHYRYWAHVCFCSGISLPCLEFPTYTQGANYLYSDNA